MRAAARALWLLAALGTSTSLRAHDGPPFPIVSDQRAGAYVISVWTDPDATDDGSAGGQFWVMLEAAESGAVVPGTLVTVAIRPAEAAGEWSTTPADPMRGDLSRQFAALLMDHEGRFDVRVDVTGPQGDATVMAWVDATYDLRPPPVLLVVYLLPFFAIGMLWVKLLVRRRGLGPPGARHAGGNRRESAHAETDAPPRGDHSPAGRVRRRRTRSL